MSYERVELDARARSALSAHTNTEPERETGGILLGHLRDNVLVVTGASPPGPRAVKRPRFFKRDAAFLQRWLTRRFRASGARDDYVGEWHVHHALDTPPSPVDKRSLWRIAKQSNYPTAKPLLIIVEDVPGTRRLRGYAFEAKPKRMTKMPLQ